MEKIRAGIVRNGERVPKRTESTQEVAGGRSTVEQENQITGSQSREVLTEIMKLSGF